MSIPGCDTSFPSWLLLSIPLTWFLYFTRVSFIPSETFFSSTMMSWTPTVNPLNTSQLFTSCWTADKKLDAWCAPYSLETICAILLPTGPRIYLVKIPYNNSPFSIKTFESLWHIPPLLFFNLTKLILGIIIEKSYFPLHRVLGFKIAGVGRVTICPPFIYSGIHMHSCMAISRSMNVSLDVISIEPSRLSWTIPITGLLLWGDII